MLKRNDSSIHHSKKKEKKNYFFIPLEKKQILFHTLDYLNTQKSKSRKKGTKESFKFNLKFYIQMKCSQECLSAPWSQNGFMQWSFENPRVFEYRIH